MLVPGPADVPAAVVGKLRQSLVDSLGCLVLGLRTPWGQIVRAHAQEDGEGPVWLPGFERGVRVEAAALAAGTLVHSLDYDDYHFAKVHPSAVVLPTALALAQSLEVPPESGRLLCAVAFGYEVMIRASLAMDPAKTRLRGFHLTGVCGTLGAAVAAGLLMDLDADQMVSAIGLAGTQSAGLWAFNADGSMSKRFHPGRAAQSGILAAQLAKRGFTGPAFIFETDDGGLWSSMSGGGDRERLVGGFGTSWDTEDLVIKPYACCGSIHSTIDAMRSLSGQVGSLADVEKVVLRNSHVVFVQTGQDYLPSTVLKAQMSLRYAAAMALGGGSGSVDDFEAPRIHDAELTALTSRMELVVDPQIDHRYPAEFPAAVEVRLRDGTSLTASVEGPLGSAGHPVPAEHLRQKFYENTRDLWSEGQQERVWQIAMQFPDGTPELAEFLRSAAEPGGRA